MRAFVRAAAAAAILSPLVLACSTSGAGGAAASPSPPVPVGGAASDLAALNGRWEGDYSSPETGRTGSIVFEFRGGTGAGDVLMKPKSSAGMPQMLTIQFVQAKGGELSGSLAPYVHPDCDCEVRTQFHGRRDGDVVRGTFTTERTADPEKKTSGTWSVRKATRPPEKSS